MFYCILLAWQSITGHLSAYREVCEQAATDPACLSLFRSIPEFRVAFEIGDGTMFSHYVAASDKLLLQLEDFRRMEAIGSPPLIDYPVVGKFTATTLRYICIADQILKMVPPGERPIIAEIGPGFGGQCYILSQIHPFSKYYFYDLPEVESLIGKMMEVLHVENTRCIPFSEPLPEERIDLVISNYAFSECDRELQLSYFDRVIRKADRGYIIYNQIIQGCGIDSLSPDEFIQLLKDNGFRPRTYKEILATAPGNILITWNRTKK